MNEDANDNPMAGNQHATKHGAEGAIRRISEGKPFLGLAADTEKAVIDDLAQMGMEEIVRRDAIRLQTVNDLYYSALLKAAESGDLTAFDRYVARFGWIAGVTLRAWAQVATSDKDKAKGGSVSMVDALNSIRRAKDAKSE